MITTKNMALNVYFKHSVKLTEEKDTIIDGMQRFGATEEVIQCSSIDNQFPGNSLDELLKQNNCTYVKTPASFFTEMQLPISKIVEGEHYKDSINLAQINIRKTFQHALDVGFEGNFDGACSQIVFNVVSNEHFSCF